MDHDEILKQIEVLRDRDDLSRSERKRLKKLERKLEKRKGEKTSSYKRLLQKGLILLIVIGIVGGLAWFTLSRPKLPPTNMQGHIEKSPSFHVLDKPMPEVIQKHMLEHADGAGRPGVIIQYNCKKYSCEKNLVANLKKLVKNYPEHVYLAPGDYDGKIILTKLGEREILDKFDEQKISDFVEE